MSIPRDVLERQLGAVHASLAAATAAVEAAMSAAGMIEDEEADDAECKHPAESRRNYSTSGWERWQCGLCGHMHEKPVSQ